MKLQIMYKSPKINYKNHKLKTLLKQKPIFPSSKREIPVNKSFNQSTSNKMNAARLIAEHFNSIFNGTQQSKHNLSQIHQLIKEEELDRSQIISILDSKLSLAVNKFNRNICTMLENSQGLKEYCYGGVQKDQYDSNDSKQGEEVLKKKRASQKFLEEVTKIIEDVVGTISKIIELINRQNPWCQCNRQQCPIRYQQSSTKEMIVESIEQSCKIKLSKKSREISRNQQPYKFFTFLNDFTCTIQSIQKLQTANTASHPSKQQPVFEEVIRSIQTTQIQKQNRIKCPFFNKHECDKMIMNFIQF